MARISVVDAPVTSFVTNGEIIPRRKLDQDNPDQLGTGSYAESLAKFIRGCETPITIGVQGEWGSGKTSLLNMIREDIEEEERTIQRGKVIKGKEEYKTIWINTWEHSLLRSPEQCLLSIIEELIDEIARVDGGWQSAQKAKSALSALARGAVRVGAGLTMGVNGAQVAEEIMGNDQANSVKQLRTSLENIVKTVVDRDQNRVTRFVIFVDDLDRLEPEIAVMVLELLKNIFTIEHCVFVLAIDYQVVVKGLKGKFGEPSDENEWEFRAFFDKIIQLPFMMPMAGYDLKKYINKLLIDDIGYFSRSEKKSIEDGRMANVVKLTLGHNPRSMKRLLNALSLIKIQQGINLSDYRLRQLVFAIVCFQISYPKVYELLMRKPDFSRWDAEFVNKITGGLHEENKDVGTALDAAMQVHEDDFDEEWEQALFKIVWLNNWQKNKLLETSRLMSEIKDVILQGVQDAQFSEMLETAMEMTAVTAVASTEDGIFASRVDGDDGSAVQDRMNFWSRFSDKMKGSKCVFDPENQNIRSTHSSGYLCRKHDDLAPDRLQFTVTTSSGAPLKFESFAGSSHENFVYFENLRELKSELESVTNGRVVFKLNEAAAKQAIIFEPPSTVKKRLRLDNRENKEVADIVHAWLVDVLPKIENILSSASVVEKSL